MTWEMKLDERYRQGMEAGRAEGLESGRELGRAEGREVGRSEGEIFKLTNQIRKKLQKGKSLSVIAEECEEEESVIQEIIESINAER